MHTFADIGTEILVPGKLVIAGEYAVLDGAPALVLAIEHGVGCRIEEGTGIDTPTGDTRFVAPILQEHAKHRHFRFFDWNPVLHFGREKPGFGGSAASCVAACVAAKRDPHDAFALHHQIQGSGSGIDVAASIHGGLLRFQNKTTTTLPPIQPLVIWSGNAAKTGPRVQQYLQYSNRASFVKESTSIVEHFAEDPITACRSLYRLLCSMAQHAGVAYQTDNIHSIVQEVERYGGGAKPSGAGGGDCVIALFPDHESLQAFQKHTSFPCFLAQPSAGIQKRSTI